MDKWKEIADRLNHVYARVYLEAGGHCLTVVRVIEKEKVVTAVYVDGVIDGKWTAAKEDGSPAFSQGGFWRPYRARAWKLKSHAALKKIYGKKEADRMTALKTVAYLPSWNSLRTFISHMKKNYPDVRIVEKESAQ